MLVQIGIFLYIGNLVVGAMAQTGRYRFGRVHHVLYFLVFAAALLAGALNFQPALLLTVGALAVLPRSRPGTWRHPTVALVGLSGYALALAN